ncbi:hypothetical protein YC2023_002562 [Brassica napus]
MGRRSSLLRNDAKIKNSEQHKRSATENRVKIGADGEDVFEFDNGDSFLCDLGREGTAQVLGS